jgi:uncharacterized protein YutE (UPF0331/DUF86 family)
VSINRERLLQYLDQIRLENEDIQLILEKSDQEILADNHYLKSLKYSIIVIAEAIGSILQHILAKKCNIPVSGFSEAINKAKNKELISSPLLERLLPFMRFRNLLVHQYWKINDQVFLQQIRTGHQDFTDFILEISNYSP